MKERRESGGGGKNNKGVEEEEGPAREGKEEVNKRAK